MMEGEQFSLCWNNFHSNLSSGFNSLLKDEDLVDVTLAAEGKFVKAHKTILSVCSPFFKDLFKANPSKHPIVILPEVKYGALSHLLQFMYQGEVSVSQEEIPMFMRVAEMLKVKGLTDNSSPSEPNGYPQSSRSPYNLSTTDKVRRPRPVKKIIKPMQPLRPIESSPPKAKKPHLDDNSDFNNSAAKLVETEKGKVRPELLIKPKVEPIDHNEHDDHDQSHTFDDKSLGDTSASSSSHWPLMPTMDNGKMMQDSAATPGGSLMLLKSGRGQLVLIHNGHIYTHCDIMKDNRHIWICVKKKTLNCEGCLTTLNGPILLSYSGHNHAQLQDVIQKLQVPSCSISPELL